MSLDLLIPFGILLALVVYLIYTRSKFENNIVKLYETKFEEWKKHNPSSKEEKECKELVGLVFKEGYKLKVELLDEKAKANLQKGKFEILTKD